VHDRGGFLDGIVQVVLSPLVGSISRELDVITATEVNSVLEVKMQRQWLRHSITIPRVFSKKNAILLSSNLLSALSSDM